MEFVRLFHFDDFRVNLLYKAYCETFPEMERRSKSQFKNLFKKKEAQVFSILNSSDYIGYFIIWELEHFVFLEHFEIFKEFRNHHFGAKVLRNLTATNPHVVLETEPESINLDSKRRIDFYKRNGFKEILDSYVQPSYGEGKTSLELLLFANFQPENLERITENIYDVVYRKS